MAINYQIAVTSTPVLVSELVWGFIKNAGTNIVYIGDAEVTISNGFPLDVGQTIELRHETEIYAVCASTKTSVIAVLAAD